MASDRAPEPAPGAPDRGSAAPGEALLGVAIWSTVLFTFVQLVATAVPRGLPLVTSVIVSLVLFLLGCVAFLWGFGAAVGRSRDEEITLSGLVFLTGTAPDRVRRVLLGALAAQCVVALAAAGLRPFTPVAFGILVPMLGIGLLTSWGGRYGEFGDRSPQEQAAAADPDRAPDEPSPAAGATVRKRPDPLEEIDDFDRLFSGRRRRGRSAPE